jgi:2-keto-4-pentenoate hydratase
MHIDEVKQAAEVLVGARREKRRLRDLPEKLRPATLADAYAIQDAAIAMQGSIGGWKVAPFDSDADPICAAIPSGFVRHSPAQFNPSDGLIAPEIEVEIAVRFSASLPRRAEPYRESDVVAAIGSIHLALEILSSRFENRKSLPFLTPIADGHNNGAVVYGAAVTEWRSVDLATVAMSLAFDGRTVRGVDGGPSTSIVLRGLTWLANHTAARTGGLLADQIVITGARIKPTPVDGAREVVAEAAELGRVSAVFG